MAEMSSSRVAPSFFICSSSVCSRRMLRRVSNVTQLIHIFGLQDAAVAPLRVQRHFALLQLLVNKPQEESLDSQSRTIAASAASLAATAMVIRLTASVASFSAAMQAALAVSARSIRAAEPENGGNEQ
jgi:hypothetical protein